MLSTIFSVALGMIIAYWLTVRWNDSKPIVLGVLKYGGLLLSLLIAWGVVAFLTHWLYDSLSDRYEFLKLPEWAADEGWYSRLLGSASLCGAGIVLITIGNLFSSRKELSLIDKILAVVSLIAFMAFFVFGGTMITLRSKELVTDNFFEGDDSWVWYAALLFVPIIIYTLKDEIMDEWKRYKEKKELTNVPTDKDDES